MPKRKQSTPIVPSSYARATVVFVCFALVIAAGALYLSLARTTITVTPRAQTTTIHFPVTVREVAEEPATPLPENVLAGRFLSKTLTAEDEFTALGTGSQVPAQASGTLTITNNWTKEQPLAATTRFLSDKGVLFRLKERVDAPPGGKITAEVYADEPGETGNINPSHFTLPGLWPGLRDKIFAESAEPMTGGVVTVRTLAATDIRTAEETLRARALEQARTEFSSGLSDPENRLTLLDDSLTLTVLKSTSSAEVGETVSEFTASLTARVEGVALADLALVQLVEDRTREKIPDHTIALTSWLTDERLTIDRVNADARTIDLTVSGTIQTVVTLEHPMFDRANLTNRDAQSIRTYFSTFEEIESIDIDFSPFWSTRSSSLADHIEVRLNAPSP